MLVYEVTTTQNVPGVGYRTVFAPLLSRYFSYVSSSIFCYLLEKDVVSVPVPRYFNKNYVSFLRIIGKSTASANQNVEFLCRSFNYSRGPFFDKYFIYFRPPAVMTTHLESFSLLSPIFIITNLLLEI
jgi:hypothetical protein